MSTLVWQGFHHAGAVAAFDHEAADREYERTVRAAATLEDARERVEQFEKQRPDIEAELAQRRARLREIPAAPQEWRRAASRGLVDEVSPPAAFEASLEEIVARRINVAGAQNAADRESDRAFLIEAVGQALGLALEEAHRRIDALEHDVLQLRGLLHEHGLSIRSLLPDPHDLLSAKTPLVLARAGSRDVKERAANRSWPATDSAPWFSQPFFSSDDD